ncbi:MAG: hypothetical protein UX13_C0015G0015 [Candidatus Woesebacteria bacterium GW2011_GWB1_45_5]|uniref:L,D-TPase catalytic domain-containing protein n=1 Tax=Candidatus Woesebacteria bacterium GW2011_GWB1_45_5 TaxID=1618581 RepID=A0A0G1MPM8_9BACT|nr:MAG: hypothetical protein UX13_C0015G0015 [Candidatus Woesebacteria bacterium GW2011_GWB1_45_5]
MKKPVIVILLAAAIACNFSGQIEANSKPTEMPFAVPDLSSVTYKPTVTPLIVTPTPTSTPVIPYGVPRPDTLDKEIVVELSTQQVFVYENGELLNTFLVSTGTSEHPTVQGHFPIWIKLESDRMTGPGYDLKGVPWVMYFYQGYGLHGTYWHNNFGHPMSHGCVNLRTEDAKWLFDWAEVGTVVWVIP